MTELTKNEVTELMLAEMLEHDLFDVQFSWNNSKSMFGVVVSNWNHDNEYVAQSIHLSAVLFNALEDKWEMVDTLYHELAHAIAIKRYGKKAANHGPLWRMVARELGCSANRCRTADVDTAKMKYKYTTSCDCGRCGRGISRLGRIWKNNFHGMIDGYEYYTCKTCKQPIKVHQNY